MHTIFYHDASMFLHTPLATKSGASTLRHNVKVPMFIIFEDENITEQIQ